MIRICSGIGPTKPSAMTVTSGSLMYFASRCSNSRARAVGVLPIATTSSTSGIESLPSGRTGTVRVSSGLRQTKIFKLSPGPIRYSADGSDDAGGAGGNGGAPPHAATENAMTAVIALKHVRYTLRSCSAFHTPANIDSQQMVGTNLRTSIIPLRGLLLPQDACAIPPKTLVAQCSCRFIGLHLLTIPARARLLTFDDAKTLSRPEPGQTWHRLAAISRSAEWRFGGRCVA